MHFNPKSSIDIEFHWASLSQTQTTARKDKVLLVLLDSVQTGTTS